MKIFVLTINKVDDTPQSVVSSFIARRHERRVEYYATKEGAEARQVEIYSGVKKLVGFVANFEAIISEVEVKP